MLPKIYPVDAEWPEGLSPRLAPGDRIEWMRGSRRLSGYIRDVEQRGGWPIYSVSSNGRVYRVLPQDCWES